MKRAISGFLLPALFLISGCATTGRNYQTDVDALNARVSALQGQLAAKDQEINSLQNQANDQRLAREASEAALHNAENEKRMLADQLENAKAQSHKAKAPASDLK